jgi:hypothetical protein
MCIRDSDVVDYGVAEGKNLVGNTSRTKKDITKERQEMIKRGKSYFRTRETPLVGIAHDIAFEGKDYEGNPMTLRDLAKPSEAARTAYKAWGPSFAADIVKGFSQGVDTGVLTLPTILGQGVTVITPEMKQQRREARRKRLATSRR